MPLLNRGSANVYGFTTVHSAMAVNEPASGMQANKYVFYFGDGCFNHWFKFLHQKLFAGLHKKLFYIFGSCFTFQQGTAGAFGKKDLVFNL
jgi:hypothetical protein